MTLPLRKKRPIPERERPVRSWATLFGSKGTGSATNNKAGGDAAPAGATRDTSDTARALTDTVGLGYRIIDEYIRQGQQVAQGLNPGGPSGATSPHEDLSQMQQRLMQYGWDFAGLWFEIWSTMSASGGTTAMRPTPPAAAPSATTNATIPSAATLSNDVQSTEVRGSSGVAERVVVSVSCQRPTTTALEMRAGARAPLVVHTLRPEGHEALPIRDIALEREDDGALMVRVTIAAEQPPGTYNAMIVDATTNLPRGTLSVVVHEGPA